MPMRTKCAVVDNYDSFTYNLVHMIKELGVDVTVLRNDRFDLMDLMAFDRIVLSPGPGIPSEAGLLLDVIRRYAGIRPILGVCLGHQAIGEVFGARLLNLSDVFHGVSAKVTQVADTPLFAGLPRRFPVGRYHSWVVERESMPDCLEITAESDEGLVMALHHRTYDIHGIQFHPESVLTPDGKRIMENWLHI
ncbi:anthranilate synthase component II [Prevotella denticola]|uniref:anthranilate synthase component II n=1 Tax=Prevotella denticola TaxID=28129 RepID=UPI001C5D5A8F|nr:aminodeoxychorismate/anthranilate synthase component II [Prevotella denticola]MBW4715115.1 aminodeoxychorismate/anthranilate synthase component II [Prevotella denticola]MBW4752885.1 aminodeoxychorismate/anthranilate synthase component II [Prevotella denticola]